MGAENIELPTGEHAWKVVGQPASRDVYIVRCGRCRKVVEVPGVLQRYARKSDPTLLDLLGGPCSPDLEVEA